MILADQWYDAPELGKCRLSRRNTKLEMMNGTARMATAGSVHQPASAAITPPVAATENIGPTLDTDSGTRSRKRNACASRGSSATRSAGTASPPSSAHLCNCDLIAIT